MFVCVFITCEILPFVGRYYSVTAKKLFNFDGTFKLYVYNI